MDNSPKKKSVALQRNIHAYPPPKYYTLVDAMSKCREISKSEVVSIALKEYFDRMPEGERQTILTLGRNHY